MAKYYPMVDAKEVEGRDSINLNENYEVRAWCQMFEVSSKELREAIDKVGRSALKVAKYFKKTKGTLLRTSLYQPVR